MTDTQTAQIHADVLAVSDGTFESGIWDWDFHIIDTRPIGGGYVFDQDFGGIPFGIAKETEDGEIVRPAEIQKHFGFLPQQMLQLDAMIRGKPAQIVLAEFSLHYLTAFGGVIDFNGPLLPTPLRYELYDTSYNWSEIEMHFNTMVAGMPGKIASIEYKVNENKTWATHVADAAFLQAWLQHPDFHMVN